MNPLVYLPVVRELEAGTPPELVCAVCSWDRACVQPPRTGRDEWLQDLADAATNGTLLPLVAAGQDDQTVQVCPVLAARLRSPRGRDVADAVKAVMQGWRADVATPAPARRDPAA